MSTSNGNDGSGLAATQNAAGAGGGNGNVSGAAKLPDPEVSSLPKRRRFSADYKARVVEEAEACTEAGDIGALLRREGLYSSQLSQWRKQYRTGALRALRDDKRGRKVSKHPLEDENEKLRRQNARLADRKILHSLNGFIPGTCACGAPVEASGYCASASTFYL